MSSGSPLLDPVNTNSQEVFIIFESFLQILQLIHIPFGPDISAVKKTRLRRGRPNGKLSWNVG